MRWILLVLLLACSPCYALQFIENCSDITDWTDADVVNGVSTQATFDSKSTMKLLNATATSGSFAARQIDGIVTVSSFIIETSIYNDNLGVLNTTNLNFLRLNINKSTTHALGIAWASDGLFARTGSSSYTEIGTDLVDLDVWTTWRIFANTTTNKIWVWKNGVLVASNVDCGISVTGATNGRINFSQYGYTVANVLSYVDYLRIYSEDGQLIQTVIE